jgi:hypothetical protein
LLLFLYLTSATEFNQLLKLPVLIAHFNEHRELDQQLSLAGFLYMHYTDHDLNDNDQDRDMQLPFKSQCNLFSGSQYIPTPMELASCGPVYESSRVIGIYRHPGLQSSYFSSIWQPPKTC